MELWKTWYSFVEGLRDACKRQSTFFWMVIALMAMSCRGGDLVGVTSFVRILGLIPGSYPCLLNFFHSPSLQIEMLVKLWSIQVLKRFTTLEIVNGCCVLIADGIKTAKEGKKMPGVKSLHQESESNSKAEYIMGHSIQAVGVLVKALSSYFCVPLTCEIHEGLVLSNRDKRTLYDKLLTMILKKLDVGKNFYLVADAYYFVRKMVGGITESGNHLITKAKKNSVAYEQAPKVSQKKRGRPKIYGEQKKLKNFFKKNKLFKKAQSPIKGDDCMIEYYSEKLLWRACGQLVLYVFVKHPVYGNAILVCTDLELCPLEVIRLYNLRSKIEGAFKQSLYTIGAFAYHFWMKDMTPIKRGDGNQYLHHKTEEYRQKVARKMEAYHRFMILGFIAQGIQQYLSIHMSKEVWKNFGSWIRTKRQGHPPSEMVVSSALNNRLPDFLANKVVAPIFKKFMLSRIDKSRSEGRRMIA